MIQHSVICTATCSYFSLLTSAPPLLSRTFLPNRQPRHKALHSPVMCANSNVTTLHTCDQPVSSRINSLLTNITARAALRSLRYFSRYFSFWVFRAILFILVLCSEELMGEEKTWTEEPEPELDAVCCVRKDWDAKACRACCRSSLVWEETEVGWKKSVHFKDTRVAEDTLVWPSEWWMRIRWRQ